MGMDRLIVNQRGKKGRNIILSRVRGVALLCLQIQALRTGNGSRKIQRTDLHANKHKKSHPKVAF